MKSNSAARRAILRLGRKSRRSFNRLMIGSSKLGDPAVFPAAAFPWIGTLQAEVPAIQAELSAIMAGEEQLPGVEEISPDHSRIARDRQWRSFFLHAYGYRSEPACALCPRTAELVDAIPGLETAFFSVLQPGAHLPPHKGVTKALITCHLPLLVPDDYSRCWIRIEAHRHHWRTGEPLVFDDTRTHEVVNDTGQTRVVLLIHVRRPLRFPGSVAAAAFMAAVKRSPFVKDGVRNQKRWERGLITPKSSADRLPFVTEVESPAITPRENAPANPGGEW